MGHEVLKALNMKTGFTHMEWYRKSDGEVVFGEIAVRPAGARTVDLMNFVSDIDLFRGYAEAEVHGRFSATGPRKYNTVNVFKRAQARFAMSDGELYPDATFTLRLAFGQVKGYEDQGKMIPPWTTMGGAFDHAESHKNIEPFKLPESWFEAKNRMDLNTPFNFVCTADIIGGNSGSPVINREGEVVGIIFDGNIYSLVLDFVYTDVRARAVSVHSAAIVESLRSVYGASDLADELQGSGKRSATTTGRRSAR